MRSHRFLRIYRLINSISLVICAACLMAGCLSIYYSGDSPYSREAVAAAFSGIALPVYLCLGLTVGNLVLSLFFPEEKTGPKGGRDLREAVRRTRASRILAVGTDAFAGILRARRERIRCRLTQAGILTAAAAVFLTYALNGSHFHDSDINGSMVRAMYWFLPCVTAGVVVSWLADGHCAKCLERELALLRQLPRIASVGRAEESGACLAVSRAAVFLAAVGLILLGICQGGVADVIAKAINICTECIGLG